MMRFILYIFLELLYLSGIVILLLGTGGAIVVTIANLVLSKKGFSQEDERLKQIRYFCSNFMYFCWGCSAIAFVLVLIEERWCL